MSQENEWCLVTHCACTAQVMLDAYNATVGREKEEWCMFCGRHRCLEITPGAPTLVFWLGSTFEANLLIFSTDNALGCNMKCPGCSPVQLGVSQKIDPRANVEVQLQISPPSPKSNQINKSQPWTGRGAAVRTAAAPLSSSSAPPAPRCSRGKGRRRLQRFNPA